ncbi:TolC family protein [Arachidicoccus sp.]|uniref:TolC family protein n=1 Tax=Arachidicoccus sp. TaxID=1872624 RepID=UPI003D25E5FB
MKKYIYLISCFLFCFTTGRSQERDSIISDSVSVEACVSYALQHYPLLQQSVVYEALTSSEIKSKLDDWYPQIGVNGTVQHDFQLPRSVVGGQIKNAGLTNNSAVQFGLTQNIFNRDALLASQTKNMVMKAAKQDTKAEKIDVAVGVSKAYYDVLLTQQQINVLNEDILRLKRSLKDATSQYNAGVVDKIDYKRATISLNNSVAQEQSSKELLKAKYAYLKQLMGYPMDRPLLISSDTSKLEQTAMIDTSTEVDFRNRIEYQQLQTQEQLQLANLKYQKWSYLPTISAVASYNLNFMNDQFGQLYNRNFPNSFVGLQLGLPIFQGGKRKESINQAKLQINITELSKTNMVNAVNAEYQNAMAVYKGDYANYFALKENLALALDVYQTLSLQYKAGVKTYLDVVTAETDLRSSQINFANALYQLLSDKLDVQKALGEIQN